MAVNPLFTCYKHPYPVGAHISQGFKMSGDSDKPPEKRRRTEKDDAQAGFEEMWDEEMNFSQADIQNLDIMASQALQTSSREVGQRESQRETLQQTLSVGTEFQQPQQPRPSTSKFSKKFSSSSSLSLKKNSSSSTASYPSSLSSHRSNDSRSLSSNSSVDSGKGDSKLHQASFSVEEVQSLKDQLEALGNQKTRALNELYSKDGEIKMLRESLKKRDGELVKMREEKVHSMDQMQMQRTAREESLKTERDRLQTQLQFRAHEFKELEDKCRHLEQRFQSFQESTPTKHSSPSARSPVMRKVRPDNSLSPKSGFPSTQSFLAEETTKSTSEPPPSTSLDHQQDLDVPIIRRPQRTRRHVLATSSMRGGTTGPRLVSQLLQHTPVRPSDTGDQGVIGLLHTPTSHPYMQGLQFDRDTASSLLSPVRGRRLSDIQASLQHGETKESSVIVSPDHYQMAVQGLQDLVESPTQCSDCALNASEDISQTQQLSGAVLILPLINDYLTHYVEMLSNTYTRVPSSGSTSSGSFGGSTSGSSLESVTSAMGLLLKDCQNYANNLENLCLASLRTLRKLVKFSSAVRRSLVDRNVDWNHHRSPPSLDGVQGSADTSGSGEIVMETDTLTTSSSDTDTMSLGSRVTFRQLQELNLLYKITRLAHPQQEIHSVAIVEEALNIINVLAGVWGRNDLVRLHCALSRGTLSRCLECRSGVNNWGIITRAVSVVGHLSRCQKVSKSLCTKSESCPLFQLYLLSLKVAEDVDWSIREIIYTQTILCMSNMSADQSNVGAILSNNCPCSAEAGHCLVLCLRHLYQHYQTNSSQNILQRLRDGLVVLHLFQQKHDNYLTDRDYELQQEYVSLVCALTSLFRQLPGSHEAEINALSDLWDFNQDDSELSQESDQEDSMDT